MGKFQKILLLEIRYNLYFAEKISKVTGFLSDMVSVVHFFINLNSVQFSLFHSVTHEKNQRCNYQQLSQGPLLVICACIAKQYFLAHITPPSQGNTIAVLESVSFGVRPSESVPSRGAR